MKKLLIFSLALLLGYGILAGCSAVKEPAPDVPDEPKEETKKNEYKQITQSEAKALMDSETNYIILDTREQYEFDEGHIAGAILIPYTEIEAKAASALPDKDQLILVYCRSGRRSKIAAQSLADLGYTNVQEFGGIIDWEYGVVTD